MIRVLGSVDVGDGAPLRSRAQRMIVAALVLEAGTAVTVDRLADVLWGDDQPADPSGALQSHVSRLRRLLPSEVELVAEGNGYVLRVPTDHTDVARFEAGYRDAIAAGGIEDRLAAATTALALWRGVPYPDLDDTGAAGERARLTEIRGSLLEIEAESLVRSGRAAEAIGSLEALRVEDPFRERAVEWLMRAYVSTGRKTDALHTYRMLREELVDLKGLDPSPELRELERAIITEEFVGYHAASTSPHKPTASEVIVPSSAFVGRDHDVIALSALLRVSRVVTLVGPGGVGKTRLAVHGAAAVADAIGEVDIVELASLRDGEWLAESVATMLGIPPQAGVTATRRVIDAAGNRSRLIVLDNCEHVIDDAAEFVDSVVRASPHVVVLATSREPLNIDGEVVVRVEPLSVEGPAVELFVDRASHLGRPVEDDDTDRSVVEQICRSLDGLPLAIELAAAQLGAMTLDELADAVSRPIDVLRRGRRTADDRHRSLRELVEWSVRDLDPTLAAVFTASAAFAGPFTASAVAAVSALSQLAVASALADLVDRSLLIREPGSGPVARFTALETIRAYAAVQLEASDQMAAVAGRHGDWVLSLVDGISNDLERWAEAEASEVVSVHFADLRVAHQRFLANHDADRALRLSVSLHYEAYYGMNGEIFGWITETANRFGASGHPAAESVLASASIGAWQRGDLVSAAEFASQATKAIDVATPGAGRGAAESSADVARFSDDHEAARDLYDRAVERARDERNPSRVVTNLADGAMIAGYLGDIESARGAIAEARALVGADGPLACRAWIEYAEGEALADHDPGAAIALLERAVDLAQQSRAAFIIGVTRLTFTSLQIRAGDPADAVPGLIALIEHWRTQGARLSQWITMRSVIEIFLRLEAHRDAAAVLGAVIGSGTAAEDVGADAERLTTARAMIRKKLPDAEDVMSMWAQRSQDAIVDHVLSRLLAMRNRRPLPTP